MKVTAIIPDELISEVVKYSKATTVTDALKMALKEYLAMKKLKELSQSVVEEPLEFKYSAKEIRKKNNT
ncbi:DUF2191 domain-containing protein [Echinicola sediminis]